MSATMIWIMCVAIVAALAIGVAVVMLASRRPGSDRARVEPRRGRVQGGTHQGGGRSVGPHRDGEVFPDESPDKPTVPVRKRGTSPMDL